MPLKQFNSLARLAAHLSWVSLCAMPAVSHAFEPTNFVTASAGHFYRDSARVRFWGEKVQLGQITSSSRPYEEIDNFVIRISSLGYNGVRLWATQDTFYVTLNGLRSFPNVHKGDGSQLDLFDYLVYKLDAAGVSIHMTALHNVGIYSLSADPNPIVRQWATETNQKYQVPPNTTSAQQLKVYTFAPYVSQDWRDMMTQHHVAFLSHVNPYTGRRYADEPAISAWELINESQFVGCSLDKDCIGALPSVAQKSLDAAWKASIRGGRGNQHMAISGHSASKPRAKGPRKQDDHEQETAQKPLTAVQGQGGGGRHQGREDAG